MPDTHPIQCKCGQVRGVLTLTKPTNRCVCYCGDCQAFARHLQAHNAMDAHGGTEVIHVPPSSLQFNQGTENLACLRLTSKGMLRWYAACCNTPIGNTVANPRMSFIGLVANTCLPGNSQSRDAVFGPVTMVVGVESAIGDGEKPRAAGLVSGMAKAITIMVKERLSGRYRLSPFFNPKTGLAIATPKVLTASELAAAKRI